MSKAYSRRSFLGTAAAGIGAGAMSLGVAKGASPTPSQARERLPREVWIGSVSLEGMRAQNAADMVEKTLRVMDSLVPYQPDIICLPEVFAYTHLAEGCVIREVAEQVPGPVVSPFLAFAKAHNCYLICPTYSRQGDSIYIAAVLIDRQGKVAGEYHKIHPTDTEMEAGVRPGPLQAPVFDTDFGRIGIQICFDIKWEAAWQALEQAGAEIVFWPSAYAGGQEVGSRAWRHHFHMVSSTLKGASKIWDVSGEIIAQTGMWQPNWVCAPVNLEKAFLHLWPAVQKFPAIREAYGRKIRITTFDEEEWAIIESHDPEVKVADVLAAYQLPDHRQLIEATEAMQVSKR